jgi:hypothetical protein
VGVRVCLDNMEKRKFFTLPGLELEPLSLPARNQSLYCLHSIYLILCNRFKNMYFGYLNLYYMMDILQKFVKCVRFVRNSVLPPKCIHAIDFVNVIINSSRALWGMTLHSFCNVVTLKAVQTIFDTLLIVHLNQCRNLLLIG